MALLYWQQSWWASDCGVFIVTGFHMAYVFIDYNDFWIRDSLTANELNRLNILLFRQFALYVYKWTLGDSNVLESARCSGTEIYCFFKSFYFMHIIMS